MIEDDDDDEMINEYNDDDDDEMINKYNAKLEGVRDEMRPRVWTSAASHERDVMALLSTSWLSPLSAAAARFPLDTALFFVYPGWPYSRVDKRARRATFQLHL